MVRYRPRVIDNDGWLRRTAATAAALLLAFTAACGSTGDTGDSGDSETGAGPESSAPPEIDDPAVAASALRTVDACALLNQETLGDLGEVTPPGESDVLDDWTMCSADLTANGAEATAFLSVGDSVVYLEDEFTETIGGLPVSVDDETDGECTVEALTSYELEVGLRLSVEQPGGKPCPAATTAMEKVVTALHGQPPRLDHDAGSLVPLDPCGLVDPAVLKSVLPKPPAPTMENLHHCEFFSGEDPNPPYVTVALAPGFAPEAGDGEPIDLGGVRAVQAENTDTGSDRFGCTVRWLHRELPGEDGVSGWGETVSVEYLADPGNGVDMATACDSAVAVAKSVVPAVRKT